MKKLIALALSALLFGCGGGPSPEHDPKYEVLKKFEYWITPGDMGGVIVRNKETKKCFVYLRQAKAQPPVMSAAPSLTPTHCPD